MSSEQFRGLVGSLGSSVQETNFADDLFRALGATFIDVMDASDYEGANVIHDLNLPVDRQLHRRYDCVFDGGALEHVFNFPGALKSCMEMVDVGGYFITIIPANNYCGHGFYQFSPELFYSTMSEENGFELERLLFVFHGRWYSVRSPKEAKSRVELFTDEQTLLFLSARKVKAIEVFQTWPQQSDYVASWKAKPESEGGTSSGSSDKKGLIRALPYLGSLQARWRALKHARRASPKNRDWFTPIDINATRST